MNKSPIWFWRNPVKCTQAPNFWILLFCWSAQMPWIMRDKSLLTVQWSGSVAVRVFSLAHGAIIMNGLMKLTCYSNQSQSSFKFFLGKFGRLNMVAYCRLEKVNAPKQPLNKMKDRTMLFHGVISYLPKTTLTGVMWVSFVVLIYLIYEDGWFKN